MVCRYARYRQQACSQLQRLGRVTLQARALTISGQVQGVGFRPFIYRLARQHELTGWVRNNVGTVERMLYVTSRFAASLAMARPLKKAP